ncbi:MAG: hypothetical protein II921_09170 [Treponema sp.]|nr:hypothetical protein [Treponema sp.]
MTSEFENWTVYDDWLIENYDKYAVTDVVEKNGKITIEYMDKADWLLKNAKSDKKK